MERRDFLALLGALAAVNTGRRLGAQTPSLTEPIHRVANAASLPGSSQANHPLDNAIEIARRGLSSCRENINDYTAILVKRERVNGQLGEHEFMSAKIRNRKIVNGQLTQPLSVYLSFLKPPSVKGREVIFVENQNEGKLIAHEGGFKGKFLPTVSLPPDGMLAMRGQRYPMTEIGIENLIVKLIERGETARQFPDVTCEFRKNASVQDRICTMLQVTQPTRRPQLEFYVAQIFIDDALNVPIRYISYDWPAQEGAAPEIIEEYNYLNLKLNVGLTDRDFDPRNPDYSFYS
jgi:hypothetical protein